MDDFYRKTGKPMFWTLEHRDTRATAYEALLGPMCASCGLFFEMNKRACPCPRCRLPLKDPAVGMVIEYVFRGETVFDMFETPLSENRAKEHARSKIEKKINPDSKPGQANSDDPAVKKIVAAGWPGKAADTWQNVNKQKRR